MTSSNLVDCIDRQVGRLRTLEDSAGIDADLTITVRNVGSVAHQAAGIDIVASGIGRGNRVARRQVANWTRRLLKKASGATNSASGTLARKGCEGRVDLAAGAGVEDLDLQPEGMRPLSAPLSNVARR